MSDRDEEDEEDLREAIQLGLKRAHSQHPGKYYTKLAWQVQCVLDQSLPVLEGAHARGLIEGAGQGAQTERQWWLDRLAALKASGYESEVQKIAAALQTFRREEDVL